MLRGYTSFVSGAAGTGTDNGHLWAPYSFGDRAQVRAIAAHVTCARCRSLVLAPGFSVFAERADVSVAKRLCAEMPSELILSAVSVGAVVVRVGAGKKNRTGTPAA